jgi:hypothetical protein
LHWFRHELECLPLLIAHVKGGIAILPGRHPPFTLRALSGQPMAAILKTLPVRFARGQMERFLGIGCKSFCVYFFTLGRGRPKRPEPVTQLYFAHQGIILGHFEIAGIVQNCGQLPKLTTLDGGPSGWQIKPDRWVAVCRPPFHKSEETLYHGGFRGWRYFDIDDYRQSIEAKVRL